ncbi:dermonecrotic toxin SPH-like [Ixodes scapularis]|uniref:dermonecrotic toxin SPH-like n=1 Tax=Ixodes scapularis TaxID=6945 RepID=UPI001A9DAB7A|nr:dermonecrotic toxin SPH-like [Ixodes scapularis]
MICTLALLTVLAITVKCQDDRRPLYVIGHMVNSIPEVKTFLNLGANAIETDVTFSKNGTALKMYHGIPCDCWRKCWKTADIADFFQYLRRFTRFRRSEYSETPILLVLDLKVSSIQPERKHHAGVDIATKLITHLWKGVQLYRMRVVLSIGHTTDEKVLTGAIDTIKFSDPHLSLFNYVGFDVGMNDKLEDIAKMYERLGVYRNRWQGDGITNCKFVWSYKRLMKAISYRDSNKYIDKVYYWTIDKKKTIRKVIRKGVDAIITNYPNRVREVLKEREFEKTVRLATYLDDPWVRFRTKRTKRGFSKFDSDMDEMVDETSEFDFEPFPLPVSPRKPRPSRNRAIRDSHNKWPQYSHLRPFY